MKRLVAISLLGLLLFNAFGYYVLFAYEQAEARRLQLAELPDSAFDIIKLPASTYVHLEDTPFEYVNGEFQVGGKTYQTVKQRIVNDVLEIYCLRNVRADQITAKFNDFVQDQMVWKSNTSHNDSPTKQLLKSFLKDYIPNNAHQFTRLFASNTEGSVAVKIRAVNDAFLASAVVECISPPPEVA